MSRRTETSAPRSGDTPGHGRAVRDCGPLTTAQTLRLPALVGLEMTARALAIGRDKFRRMVADGDCPIPVLTVGGSLRFRLVDICEQQGIPYDPAVDYAAL